MQKFRRYTKFKLIERTQKLRRCVYLVKTYKRNLVRHVLKYIIHLYEISEESKHFSLNYSDSAVWI